MWLLQATGTLNPESEIWNLESVVCYHSNLRLFIKDRLMEDLISSSLPGMRDLLPEETGRWQLVEEHARRIFARYGFEEIRTSIIEPTELFARGIADDTDIVGKEMYTFMTGASGQ